MACAPEDSFAVVARDVVVEVNFISGSSPKYFAEEQFKEQSPKVVVPSVVVEVDSIEVCFGCEQFIADLFAMDEWKDMASEHFEVAFKTAGVDDAVFDIFRVAVPIVLGLFAQVIFKFLIDFFSCWAFGDAHKGQ